MRSILAVSFALAALVACGSAQTRPGGSGDGNPPAPSSSATVAPAEASFVLTISNQSFEEKNARLSVSIDGKPIVSDRFAVGGQHNFYPYHLALTPGSHTLTATGPDATARHDFTVPPEGVRYGVLLYWRDAEEGAKFTWTLSDTPPGFA